MKVSSLITAQGDWDNQRLHQLFSPHDINIIRSFPPNKILQDKMIWAYTKDGRFSVKSRHWLLTHEVESV